MYVTSFLQFSVDTWESATELAMTCTALARRPHEDQTSAIETCTWCQIHYPVCTSDDLEIVLYDDP